MADPETNGYEPEENGHLPEQELPDIDATSGEASGNIPGLRNLMIQPHTVGGMWNPIERAMRGSVNPEEYLGLTDVNDEDIATHMQIMYFKNLANYGNGRLEDCLWAGYQLQRARGGQLMKQVVQMVTGQRQQEMRNWQARRQGMFNRGRSGGNPMADNGQRLNSSE